MTALFKKHAQELRDTWQCRALAETKGKTFLVVLAIIAFEWPAALQTIMRVVFPGFQDITAPFICSYATVQRTGKVTAEVMTAELQRRTQIIFDSEAELIKEFRSLADRLKLGDAERIEMTAVLKKWVTSDLRINHQGLKVVA